MKFSSSARRERVLVWWGVAAPSFLLLLCLLSPTVTRGGDCGELIAASYTLGIAHPSGYPVWCLLGRIFALVPIGEIGWRYNLFSSVCGALATATIAAGVHRLIAQSMAPRAALDGADLDGAADDALVGDATIEVGVARWSALGAGWLLTGFFYVGTQFLIAEVYALAALMGALLLYFAIAWHQDGNFRDAYTLAILAGLVPVVHLSGVFFLPFLCFLAVYKRGLRAPQFATAGAFFVCALLPILYLPIRSAQFPPPPQTPMASSYYWPLDWSHPATLSGLKQHVTAAQYRRLLLETSTQIVNGKPVVVKKMAQPPSEIPARLRELATFVVLGFLWATPLLLVGLWRSFALDKRVGWVLLLIFLSNLATQINYKVSDQSNFFFPCYLIMALWMGLGLSVFLGFLWRRGGLARAAAPLLVLATVGVQWALFAPPASQRGVTRTRDGALQQARAAQLQARQSGHAATILFYSDDALWGFWYAKYVLQAAPDVITPWGLRVFQRVLHRDGYLYIEQLRRRGPVFLSSWDAPTDARHPLEMATPAGNLLLVTDRKLPSPARLLTATEASAPAKTEATPGPNGLQRARFRRVELWKNGESADAPNISIGSLAAFDVDFYAPKLEKTRINLPRQEDYVSGQIEVLIAPAGRFGKRAPAPDQNAKAAQSFNANRVLVTRQTRRLVLPARIEAGALYRASVPLLLHADSVVGRYQIWTRLVENASDKTTPWTPSDEVFLTQR